MPAANDTAETVVRELMAGKNVEQNFRWLYQRYYAAVHNFLARKGLAEDDCRDLTQEVFLAVHAGVGKLRNETAFLSWLFSIARHLWLRHLEKMGARPRAVAAAVRSDDTEGGRDPLERVASADPDPLGQVLDQEKTRAVRAALEELPDRVRDCIRARVVEGLSNREIGERFGIAENTVAVHVHRGIRKLRARLQGVVAGGPGSGDLLDE